MAAVVFLLFLVVLHATGTFSHFRFQDIKFHRPFPKVKDYQNQFLTFRDFERLYRNGLRHPFPSVDRAFDHQIFPSSWARNNGRDSSVLAPLNAKLENLFSSDSDSASRENLVEYKERQTPDSGKNFEFPDASSEYPRIIMNASSSNKTSGKLAESKNGDISSISEEENVVFGNDNDNTGKLYSTVSDEKDASKITYLNEGKRDSIKLKETNEIITDMNDSTGSAVIEEITEDTTDDEKDRKENINAGKETSDTATDVASVHGKTTANEETGSTSVDENNIDGKTIATEETSNTTADENEIDGETTTKEETNNITVGEDTNDKTSVEEKEGSTTANKETNKITTVEDETIDITSVKEQISINTTHIEDILTTESHTSFTPEVPEKITSDITETEDNDSKSTVHETTLPTDNSKTEGVSGSDFSSSSKIESTTSSITTVTKVTPPPISQTVSTKNTDRSSKSGYSPTISPDSKSSNSDFVTKPVPIIPEHVINIRSIKTAKTVLAVLLLATALISVAVLAVYFFRVRRRAVQYDQLTLLP